jgi:hypothetical protein
VRVNTGAEIIMTGRQKTLALAVSVLLLLVILELVRRRKLREEYSWLWLLTGAAILLFSVRYDLLVIMTGLIGAVIPVSTLFFLGLMFLMLISISYSVQISKLNLQVKNLAQKLAIMEARQRTISQKEEKGSN